MKKTYQSFSELAEVMCYGKGILHTYNCFVQNDEFYGNHCIAWQTGITNFAEWLDYIGVKVEISDDKENFYESMARKLKNETT